MKVMPRPDDNWLMRLAKGHWIYLCKEGTYAQVAMPYDPAEPGHVSGELAMRIAWGTPHTNGPDENGTWTWGWKGLDIWHVMSDGTGFDGNQLILPVEGNLLDEPQPVKRSEVLSRLDDLDRRLSNIERDYLGSALSNTRRRYDGGNGHQN